MRVLRGLSRSDRKLPKYYTLYREAELVLRG